MSDWWRSKAKELLPELTELTADPEVTAYLFMSELVTMARNSLHKADQRNAARYFEFARFCLFQEKDKDAHNAACVCFYEYVFDDESLTRQVASYIDKASFEKIEPFLKFAYAASRFTQIKRAVDEHPH